MEDTTNTNQDQNSTTNEPELNAQHNPGDVEQNKIPESQDNHNDEKKEENDEKNTEVQDQLDAKRTTEETNPQESPKEIEQNCNTDPTITNSNPTEDQKIDHDQHLTVETKLSSNQNTIETLPLENSQEQSNSDESPKFSSGSNSPLKDRHPKLQNLRINLVPMDNEINPDSPCMQNSQLTQQEIEGSQSEPNLSNFVPKEKKEDSKSKSSNEESKDRADSPNKVQPQTSASSSSGKISMQDFHRITSLGRGSYAEVFLVKKINTGKHYALKAIDKNFMKKEGKQHQVYVEREVLRKLDHPNIIKLYSSFQDRTKLYFVLEYVGGGEFSDYLRVYSTRNLNKITMIENLTKDQIKFFSAEILNILEHLFKNNIAHRDLKPENLLLTNEGHLKAIDFGTAKYLDTDKRTSEIFQVKKEETVDMDPNYERSHRKTFVGTAQYVSPEMLEDSDCGAAGDIWALGNKKKEN